MAKSWRKMLLLAGENDARLNHSIYTTLDPPFHILAVQCTPSLCHCLTKTFDVAFDVKIRGVLPTHSCEQLGLSNSPYCHILALTRYQSQRICPEVKP